MYQSDLIILHRIEHFIAFNLISWTYIFSSGFLFFKTNLENSAVFEGLMARSGQ